MKIYLESYATLTFIAARVVIDCLGGDTRIFLTASLCDNCFNYFSMDIFVSISKLGVSTSIMGFRDFLLDKMLPPLYPDIIFLFLEVLDPETFA